MKKVTRVGGGALSVNFISPLKKGFSISPILKRPYFSRIIGQFEFDKLGLATSGVVVLETIIEYGF